MTRTHPLPMSMSLTSRPSTSAERSPLKSISPAIARSLSVRKLPNNAVISARSRARGKRRGSRTRSFERGFGWARWPSSPARSPLAKRRAAGPLGTGLVASGSRMDRKANKPDMAARRRLIVLGASPTARPVLSGTTLSCWPSSAVVRQWGEVTKKGLGVDRAKLDALGSQPAGEVEEVEGVGPDGRGE